MLHVRHMLLLILLGAKFVAADDAKLVIGIHATDNAQAQRLGAKFIRLWDFQAVLTGILVEPTTNRWRDCTKQLEAMHAAALIPVGVLYTRQPWRCAADGLPDLTLTNGASPWMQYVDEVTRQYRQQVRFWEIWNEPDVPAFGGERTPEQYVEMVRQAAAVIHRNDAGVVIGGSSAEPLKLWLTDCLKAGLARHIDVLSVHYGYTGDSRRARQLAYIDRVRELRVASGKPIWNTETSILRQWADGSEENDFYYQPEGRALDRVLRVNQEAGVQVMFYYYLGIGGPKNPESLLDIHGRLRPWAWFLRNYR
jgi:hypothetical protein